MIFIVLYDFIWFIAYFCGSDNILNRPGNNSCSTSDSSVSGILSIKVIQFTINFLTPGWFAPILSYIVCRNPCRLNSVVLNKVNEC